MNNPTAMQYDFRVEGVDFLNSIREPDRRVSTDDWLEDIVRSLTTEELQEIYQAYTDGDISEGAAYVLLGDAMYDTESSSIPDQAQWSSIGKAF